MIPREEVQQAQDRTSRLVTIILFLALSGLLIAGANVSNILFSQKQCHWLTLLETLVGVGQAYVDNSD